MNVVVVVGAVLHKLLLQQLTFPRFKTGRLKRLDTAVQMFSDMQPLTGTEVLIPDGTVDKKSSFHFNLYRIFSSRDFFQANLVNTNTFLMGYIDSAYHLVVQSGITLK